MGQVRLSPEEHVKALLHQVLPSLRPIGWRAGDPEVVEVWNASQDVAMNDTESKVLAIVSLEGEDREDGISQEIPPMAEMVAIDLVVADLAAGNKVFEAIMQALRSDDRRQEAPEFDRWERIADEEAFTRSITAHIVI